MFARSAWILFSLLAVWQQRSIPNVPTGTQEFRIGGIVQDGLSGVPLDGAEVSIARSGIEGPEAIAPVVTSAGGHFGFERVAAGKYILFAKRRGYAPQNYEQHETFTTAIAVGPQLDSRNIVFRLLPQASIAGQVADESGEAVRRAQVILFEEGLRDGRMSIRQHAQTQTDDQGRYRFGGLPKGRYYLAVPARPWYAQNITAEAMAGRPADDPNRPLTGFRQVVEQNASLDVVYPITYYAGTSDSAKASTIALEPGAMVTADVSLAAVPALHLRLTAPGLDLSQPLNVSVSQSAFGQPIFVNTLQAWHDRESIGIVGVPPGEIRINTQSNGDSKTPLLFNESLNASQGMEINLNHQARGVPVSGMAKIPKGVQLPERTFLILREVDTGRFSQNLIQADGSFDFGDWVSPGKYIPALSLPAGSRWYVGAVEADGAEVSGGVVDLRAVDPVRLVVDISEGLGRVQGMALRDGKGVGGAMILLVSKDLSGSANVAGRDQSDSDGTFAIANVPPGEYAVLAMQNGWDQEWADPSTLQRWLAAGQTAQVAPNNTSNVRVNVQ